MTINNKLSEGESNMDTTDRSPTKDESGNSSRPIRSRRYTRRSLVAGQRPQKRLFTPEIKRYLKDWLVRRRDNPYPNREEKKYLSRETGLTYIQICNWFANWRRKLKNVNEERNQQTWSHLIRTYNDRAQGNVEHFSICSEDSIWSEPEPMSPDREALEMETGFSGSPDEGIYQHDDSDTSSSSKEKMEHLNNNTYEAQTRPTGNSEETKNVTSPILLSKWLESAARFQPSETNYSWWPDGKRRKTVLKPQRIVNNLHHDRDEVEAALALTVLANAASRVTAQ